jgi:hypothetical protein
MKAEHTVDDPDTPVSPDAPLREKARRAIEIGDIPNRNPDRTWGGRGGGAPCIVCGMPVTPEDTEIEMEFLHDEGSGADNFHTHVRCFSAWELERIDSGGTTISVDASSDRAATPTEGRPRSDAPP